MYQHLEDPLGGVRTDLILRTSDGAFVPADPQNADWQIYQHWLSQGNSPLPA
jgi:hypothetical protein